MNQHSIFIFTNNNPIKLNLILNELHDNKNYYNLHVIDDSHKIDVIYKNIILTSKFGENCYLGREAFNHFYKNHIIEDKSVSDIIGTENWNLGTARNFALDYSIIMNYEKVLFIDDDISDIDSNDLSLGFKTISNNSFISCNLKGKKDDSIVGHIASNLEVNDEYPRMLSGGFLFLNPKSLENRFFNLYNEDWILQLMEYKKKRITLPFTVTHDKYENSILEESSIYFQEIGEIIVKGFLSEKHANKMNLKFWANIISNRIIYIKELIEKAKILNRQNEIRILTKLDDWLEKLTAETILNFINIKHERTTYKI